MDYKNFGELNQEAVVVRAIAPGKKGRISLHGVYWSAKTASTTKSSIPETTNVTVVGRVGLTVIVEPSHMAPF